MKIILATSNLHKIREFKQMSQDANLSWIDWLTFHNFPDYVPPLETEKTFEKNAELKALHAAKELGEWTLADDSGLVVPILNNEPGIFSARYAGDKAKDKDNRRKLLDKLKQKSDFQRNAYFHCTLCLASKTGIQKTVTATVEGYIAEEEKGSQGFGYDPLFIRHDYLKTFAELDPHVKMLISHRRKAFEKLISSLSSLAPLS